MRIISIFITGQLLKVLYITLYTVHEIDKIYIFIYYRISVEGVVHDAVHEVDKNLNYEFIWNKRDAYGRKVYGQVKHSFKCRNRKYTLSSKQI